MGDTMDTYVIYHMESILSRYVHTYHLRSPMVRYLMSGSTKCANSFSWALGQCSPGGVLANHDAILRAVLPFFGAFSPSKFRSAPRPPELSWTFWNSQGYLLVIVHMQHNVM